MAVTADKRRAYIQEMREARGFRARRPTAEEVEQDALFLFEAAFSTWVVTRSTVVRQQRENFERECKGAWERDAFSRSLSANAKAAVCSELRLQREAFVKELETGGEISVTPPRMAALVKHVDLFVRRAKWRQHPTDYADARANARKAIKERVKSIRIRLLECIAALQFLGAPEDDALSFDMVSGLQWVLDGSLVGEALEPFDLVGRPSEKLTFALNDLDQRLQAWAPPKTPLWRSLLDPLLCVYEQASGNLPTKASWTRSSDGREGRPSNPVSKFLVMIYEALPKDAQRFAAASPGALTMQARG